MQPSDHRPPGTVVLAALVGTFLLFAAACSREVFDVGVVCDEVAYYNLALGVRDAQDFVPFTSWGVAPLPILAFHLPASLFDRRPVRPHEFNIFIGDQGDPKYIGIARVLSAAVCGSVIWLSTAAWLARIAGPWASAAGALFVGASTMVIAQTSLAGTDAPFTATSLAAISLIDRHRRIRSRKSYVFVVVGAGMCFAVKYSGALLLPIFAWSLVEPARSRVAWLISFAKHLAVLCLSSLVISWAAHGFAWVPMKTHPTPEVELGDGWKGRVQRTIERVQVPAPIKGFMVQANFAVRAAPETYLAGQWSSRGFRLYYLVGLAVKSNPAEALVLSAGLLAAIGHLIAAARGNSPRADVLLRASIAIVLLTIMSIGRKQLGVRYVLTLYPLLGALAIAAVWKQAAARGIIVALIVVHAGYLFAAPPVLLSYFSPAIGARKHGDEWLVGVDYDWGQDLKRVADWYKREGASRPVFYVGLGGPAHFGIPDLPAREYDPANHQSAILLVTRGELRDPRKFDRLLSIEPDVFPTDLTVGFNLSRPEVRDEFSRYRRRQSN